VGTNLGLGAELNPLATINLRKGGLGRADVHRPEKLSGRSISAKAASAVPMSIARKNFPSVSPAMRWSVSSSRSEMACRYPSFRPALSTTGIGTMPGRPAPIVYTGIPRARASSAACKGANTPLLLDPSVSRMTKAPLR
jgi:hypothetical protein